MMSWGEEVRDSTPTTTLGLGGALCWDYSPPPLQSLHLATMGGAGLERIRNGASPIIVEILRNRQAGLMPSFPEDSQSSPASVLSLPADS